MNDLGEWVVKYIDDEMLMHGKVPQHIVEACQQEYGDELMALCEQHGIEPKQIINHYEMRMREWYGIKDLYLMQGSGVN